MATTVTSSCPGKVLILGGYCVLERPNPGLVLAVDSRFRCKVSWVEKEFPKQAVYLCSPQWGVNGWSGSFEFNANDGLVPFSTNLEANKYIENTVSWTLRVLKYSGGGDETKCLKLEMGGDNDFYSQQENLQLQKLPRTKLGLSKLDKQSTVRNKSAKTGLGSSAAMISCIVSALVAFLKKAEDRVFAHRLAQMCHAAVQGKIGSGFDVCAAFFGSMQYVRYDAGPVPANCLAVLNKPEGIQTLLECVLDDNAWNESITKFHLPAGIELLCAEVEDSGSETPSMSKKILDWKTANPGDRIWLDLIKRNLAASEALKTLLHISENEPKAYMQTLNELSKLQLKEWTSYTEGLGPRFVECAAAFALVRDSLRLLGNAAGVPVEPKSQQLLCDATLQVPGCMVCGVPGAGGNDAIYALVLGPEAAQRVEKSWETYEACTVCPLLLRESRGGQGVELTWE